MPSDLPIGCRRLVEQEGSHRDALVAESRDGSSPNRLMTGEGANLWDTLEERTGSASTYLGAIAKHVFESS